MRAALVLAAVVMSTNAQAQWIYQGEESAFGGGGTHFAVTAKGLHGFGVRCEDGQVNAVLLTPERVTDENAAVLNFMSAELLLRVDDNPPLTLPATLDTVEGKMRAFADVELDFMQQIGKARKRVAVALQMLGERFHENNFTVSGSTRAMEKLIAACDLPQPDS